MTTAERLKALKGFIFKEVCKGKSMKTPGKDGSLLDVSYTEPVVHIGFEPTRPDITGMNEPNPVNIAPGIVLMFGQGYAERMQEQRFDRYSGIHRPKELGGTLPVSMLFKVYEPGDRLRGFKENQTPQFLREATEQGIFTLTNWMDELKGKLIGTSNIPESDMFLWKDTLTYSPYTEMGQIADKRPFFYGFINCEFGIYTDRAPNSTIDAILN